MFYEISNSSRLLLSSMSNSVSPQLDIINFLRFLLCFMSNSSNFPFDTLSYSRFSIFSKLILHNYLLSSRLRNYRDEGRSSVLIFLILLLPRFKTDKFLHFFSQVGIAVISIFFALIILMFFREIFSCF